MNKIWGIIVDTTLQGAHTALVNIDKEDSKLIQVNSCHDNYSSAAKLAVNVEKMLEIYDLNMSDISHVLLANGPGTFTGIKIGLSFVSALSVANKDLKVITLSSLEAFSIDRKKSNLSFIPATKTQGYAAYFDGKNSQLFSVEIKDSELVFKKENSSDVLRLNDFNTKTMITLKPWPNLQAVVLDELEVLELVNSTYQNIVSLNNVVDWSEARVKDDIEPRYLRRSAPEEKLIKEGKLS